MLISKGAGKEDWSRFYFRGFFPGCFPSPNYLEPLRHECIIYRSRMSSLANLGTGFTITFGQMIANGVESEYVLTIRHLQQPPLLKNARNMRMTCAIKARYLPQNKNREEQSPRRVVRSSIKYHALNTIARSRRHSQSIDLVFESLSHRFQRPSG